MLTAPQRIKRQLMAHEEIAAEMAANGITIRDRESGADIDAAYDAATQTSRLQDWIMEARDDFRSSGSQTEIRCEDYSRHYECESVARRLDDGTWVGWTYWHGGGKFGQPEEIEWLDDAYDVTVTEEEKTVIWRTFSRS